ncbi:hypothetical protein PAAG_05011 [Paracoccidioides lutzii Pb01]|uniref:Uncharacterized protein n=1 Tax=Paracoccidioides lutzii (strain ATCC MYA-826 / Pb01) TaxID=502779 RepID=C1H2L8_PARBA|nr:hypothetical protein PAAG_05011 [Paracoccidioides lutzii Pb01]EEH33962.1 hypothetical protein PAAG_05011 [Paracoccidioides lutzii Pb01]
MLFTANTPALNLPTTLVLLPIPDIHPFGEALFLSYSPPLVLGDLFASASLQQKSLTMSFPNHLPADSYEGTIDGITVKWGPNAITNLPDNAKVFKVDQAALKDATEQVAYASAKRLGKTGVRIMGSFHNTTTVTATGEKLPDECHCSISMTPGQAKVHIYVDLTDGVALHDMEVLGESVILRGKSTPDPTLSIGIYPS